MAAIPQTTTIVRSAHLRVRAFLAALTTLLTVALVVVGLPAGVAHAASPESEALWNRVSDEYKATTYDELFTHTNPRYSFILRSQLKTEYLKKTGQPMSDEAADAEHKAVLKATLNLEQALETTKAVLDEVMPDLLDRGKDTGVSADFLRTHRKSILLGLTYLRHYYSFDLGGEPAFKRIIDGPNSSGIIDLLDRLGNVGYDRLTGAFSARTFTSVLGDFTGKPTITEFIKSQLTQYAPGTDPNAWLLEMSRAVIEDRGDRSLFEKYSTEATLADHLLPLLSLETPSIYVGSITETVSYGLTASYGGPDAVRPLLTRALNEQQAFWAFWKRMSRTYDDYTSIRHVVAYDALKRGPETGADAKARWSDRHGPKADLGVRDFILPVGKYAAYFPAYGRASESDIRYWLADALTRTGISTYTHELTHVYEDIIWFNGKQMRAGIGHESYARGLYESEDNSPGVSQHAPYFNLNTAYELNDNRRQNASPTRFKTPADVGEYMRGVMDVLYSLDAMEALSALKLDDAGKAAAFRRIVQTPDLGKTTTADTFEALPLDEAAQLKTINDVVDTGLVSGRIMPKDMRADITIPYNEYVVTPLFEPIYAGQQTDDGAVGGISFRRYAHELLAEYGWENGLIAYVSNQYPNDAEALKAIMPEHGGSMAAFKKAMYERRVKNFDLMRPVAGFNTAAEMQAEMDKAVEADVTRIKAGHPMDVGTGLYGGGTAVRNLKQRIFQGYLLMTDDFRTSIYAQRTGNFDLSAKVTLFDEAKAVEVSPAGHGFKVRVSADASNDSTGYKGLTTGEVPFSPDTANLGNLTFEKPGVYTFTISQVPGTNKKIEYDDSKITVVLTVTADPKNSQRYAVAAQIKRDDEIMDEVSFANILKQPVVTEEERTETKVIPVKDEIILDNTVLAGTPDEVIRPGKPGVRTIVYVQRLIDGEPDGEPTLKSDTETTPMETRQIRRGTKAATLTPPIKTQASYALAADKLMVKLVKNGADQPLAAAGDVRVSFTQVAAPEGGVLGGLPAAPVAPQADGTVDSLSALTLKGEGTFVIEIKQSAGKVEDVTYDGIAGTLTLVTGWQTESDGTRRLVVKTATLNKGEQTVDQLLFTNVQKHIEDVRTTITEVVAIEDEIILDNTVLAGTPDEVIREGVEGERTIVKVQRMVDGKPDGDPVLESSTITKDMVTRQIRRGTKAMTLAPATVNEAPFQLPAEKFSVKLTKDGVAQPLTNAGDIRLVFKKLQEPEGGVIGGLPEDPVSPRNDGHVEALSALTFSGEGTFVIEIKQMPGTMANVVYDVAPRTLTVVTAWDTDPNTGARRLIVKSTTLMKGSEMVTEFVLDNVLTLPEAKIEYRPTKRVVKIPIEEEYIDDPTLPVGETKIVREGVEGEKEIISVQLFVNDEAVGDPEITEKVTKEMVKRQIMRGTKTEEPKQEEPKQEDPKQDQPKDEKPEDKPKVDAPQSEKPKVDAPQSEKPKADAPQSEQPKTQQTAPSTPQSDGTMSGKTTNKAKTDKKSSRGLAATGGDTLALLTLAGAAMAAGLIARQRRR